jgi:SNF2 family DNA or RNA helicase
VFFNWKHQRDMLAEEFEKRDIKFAIIDGNVKTAERVQIVADYQAGKYQTLLLHPRTGAHGLTLTRGTTTIISSPIYEADMLKQAIHRIYRGDQNKATNTILIEAKGTVEAKVYARLNDKYDRMMNLLDLLKD